VGGVDQLQAGDPRQIGLFRLLGRLGEGGMGRVYLGESPGGRKVAIKVVHPHFAGDPEFRRRFAREVDAARQVGGFHTAAVVGADPDADPPWMATAYIPGPTLAEAIARRGPLDEAGVRELGAALAEGLAAIHACGLIHRDLKPGNVILAGDGPRIIDFGIAKSTDATALTGPNAVIGTLRYMSPEQLQGQQLTPHNDVFALGAILAYAATGHDPFEAPTIPAVITRVLHDLPNLDPLTGDLRAIIADCLAKEPRSRPSPADLLARFHLSEAAREATVMVAPEPVPEGIASPTPDAPPTHAIEPESPTPREPSPGATVSVGMAVAPPPASSGTPSPATSTGQARQGAPYASGVQPQPRRNRRRTALISAGTTAVVALAVLGVLVLNNHPSGTPQATHTAGTPPAKRAAGTPWAVLTDPGSNNGVHSVAFGPGGTLATGDLGGSTYLWDTTTKRSTATLTGPASNSVYSVAFGPGGTLATGDDNGNTCLWNTTTGKLTATLTGPLAGVNSVAFGPGGTLATDDANGDTYLWNTTTGKLTATLTGSAGTGVNSVAFGPGGTLATGDDNGNAYLWNTTTKQSTAAFTGPAGTGVNSVAFGPGGILAIGDSDGHAYLRNTTTGKITAIFTDPASTGAWSVAFGPGGTLATGDGNGNAYLWNSATKRITATFTDPASTGVYSVAFGPGGTLATGDGNGHTYLWKVP
jgi:WD40 repeat protein/serine/threonine protein kinase